MSELDYCSLGAMGDKLPLSFSEIHAFMQTTQTRLNHWEVLTLRNLSYVYIEQSHKKDINELPPYLETSVKDYLLSTAVSGNSIAKKFGAILQK